MPFPLQPQDNDLNDPNGDLVIPPGHVHQWQYSYMGNLIAITCRCGYIDINEDNSPNTDLKG